MSAMERVAHLVLRVLRERLVRKDRLAQGAAEHPSMAQDRFLLPLAMTTSPLLFDRFSSKTDSSCVKSI
jgi:hypothetical protein